jgi:antitoxin component HigA of HigAB toxin-antitoxin module
MKLRLVKTEKEYAAALKEIELLFELDNSGIDPERIENLLYLIEVYEDKNYAIPEPNFGSRILYYLESRGLFH